jgi:hypothetical protein
MKSNNNQFLQPHRLSAGAGLILSCLLLTLPAIAAASYPPGHRNRLAPASSAMNRQISSAADDVSQAGGPGAPVFTVGLDILMGDNNMLLHTSGYRFVNISVPQYATITRASLLFTAFNDQAGTLNLTIHGHDAGNSPTFINANGPADREPDYTSASANWSPTPWSNGSMYQTPDLAAIVQEIVNRPDWSAGNALSFIVLDDGTLDGANRKATAFDWSPTQSAQVSIEYVENPGATAPVTGGEASAPAEPQQSVPVDQSAELPEQTDEKTIAPFLNNPSVFSPQTVNIPAAPPDLIIADLRTLQNGYQVGQLFQLDVEVTNIGGSAAGPFGVQVDLGRLVLLGESRGQIQFTPGFSLENINPLAAGDSVTLTSSPLPFSRFPGDLYQPYSSLIPGFPNNGSVLFRAKVDDEDQVAESSEENNIALTTAIYPTGADGAGYDPELDQDGDGWMTPQDCDDGNPLIYPGAYEYVDDTDADCDGYDEGVDNTGFGGLGGFANIGLVFGDPRLLLFLFKGQQDLDLDQDGYPHSQDCNDFNAAQHPGAIELADGLDNNCDGLVDEGFVIPDFTITEFQLDRYPGSCTTCSGGVSYEVQLEYLTGDMGPFALDQAAGAIQIMDLSGQVFSVGDEGFIPYTDFPGYAYSEVMACSSSGLFAILPSGAYGEQNFANNWAIATLEDRGGPNVDIEFNGNYFVPVITRRSIRIRDESDVTGACPPPTIVDFMVRVAIDVEGGRVYEAEQLVHNPPPPGFFEHTFNPRLSGGDEVRIEIELNSDSRVNEDSSNNLCVIEGIFRRPFHISLGSIGFNSFLEVQNSSGCLTPSQSTVGLSSNEGFGGLAGVLVITIVLVLTGVGGGTGWRIARRMGLPAKGLITATLVSASLVGSLAFTGLSAMGAPTGADGDAQLPSAVNASARARQYGLVRADVVTRGPIRGREIGDLETLNCESFVQAASEVITSPDGALEDVLLHLTPGPLARPESRYRVTLWDSDGIPREFVTGDGTASLASLDLLTTLDDPTLWQVGVETSTAAGGDLFQSVCLPRRMQVIDLPGTSTLPDQQAGEPVSPRYACDGIISISHQDKGELLLSLSCPGVSPLEYPAMIQTFEGRCVTDERYSDRLFCTSKSPLPGTFASIRVWDIDGMTLFEGTFTVPLLPATEPPKEPTLSPAKPGPTPTKPSG